MPDCLLCDLGFKPVNIVTMPVLYDGRIRYLHLKESNPLYKHLKMMKDFNGKIGLDGLYPDDYMDYCGTLMVMGEDKQEISMEYVEDCQYYLS